MELYDSLGAKKTFASSFEKFGKSVSFIESATQPEDSKWCGQFCIYLIYQRLFNWDIDFLDLLEDIFKPILTENQILVETFCIENNVGLEN